MAMAQKQCEQITILQTIRNNHLNDIMRTAFVCVLFIEWVFNCVLLLSKLVLQWHNKFIIDSNRFWRNIVHAANCFDAMLYRFRVVTFSHFQFTSNVTRSVYTSICFRLDKQNHTVLNGFEWFWMVSKNFRTVLKHALKMPIGTVEYLRLIRNGWSVYLISYSLRFNWIQSICPKLWFVCNDNDSAWIWNGK